MKTFKEARQRYKFKKGDRALLMGKTKVKILRRLPKDGAYYQKFEFQYLEGDWKGDKDETIEDNLDQV